MLGQGYIVIISYRVVANRSWPEPKVTRYHFKISPESVQCGLSINSARLLSIELFTIQLNKNKILEAGNLSIMARGQYHVTWSSM